MTEALNSPNRVVFSLYAPSSYKQYSHSSMESAVQLALSGTPIRSAAARFGVPRMTLSRRVMKARMRGSSDSTEIGRMRGSSDSTDMGRVRQPTVSIMGRKTKGSHTGPMQEI